MSALHLADLTWPEVPDDSLLVVPIGSCEQHGPHLPLDTDLRIAAAMCEALGAVRHDVVIAPPITVTASGEHQSFAGTLSIGTIATEAVVVELVRSALPPVDAQGDRRPRPFRAVVLVNGHGGNVEALQRAEGLLIDEGRDVFVWHPRVPDGDSHAGATETSLLLHLDPGCVRQDRIEPGSTARWREIGPAVVAHGLAAVTANGVLGDPTRATADDGRLVHAQLVEDLVAAVAVRYGSG